MGETFHGRQGKGRGGFGGVVARRHVRQDDTQTVHVGARVALAQPAILLGGGVARRAQEHGILRLPRLEEAGDPEVDQLHLALVRQHNVARLEIAEDDRRRLVVQIGQHVTELPRDVQRLGLRRGLVDRDALDLRRRRLVLGGRECLWLHDDLSLSD